MCAQADVACNIPVYLFIMNVLVPQLAKKVFAPALEVARRHSLKLARSGTLGSTNAVRRIAHAWIIRTRNRVESRKLSAVAPQLEHTTVDVVPSGMVAADGLRPPTTTQVSQGKQANNENDEEMLRSVIDEDIEGPTSSV